MHPFVEELEIFGYESDGLTSPYFWYVGTVWDTRERRTRFLSADTVFAQPRACVTREASQVPECW